MKVESGPLHRRLPYAFATAMLRSPVAKLYCAAALGVTAAFCVIWQIAGTVNSPVF
jgi:hypothetical protein